MVALAELDLELDAAEERRRRMEDEPVRAGLELVGETCAPVPRPCGARQTSVVAAVERRARRPRPARPRPCRARASRARLMLRIYSPAPGGARAISRLVGADEGAAVDDELAGDVEPVDAKRRREHEPSTGSSAPPSSSPSSRPNGEVGARCPARSTPMSSRASTAAPPRVAIRSASRAVRAVGPPRPRATSSACLTSKQRSLRSFEAEPSTPRPTRTPASSIARTGATPAPRRRLEVGQCATPVPVAAKRCDLRLREVDAVRAPDVAVEPAEPVEVLDGRAAEALAAVLLLLDRLGEVRVELQAELARELGRLRHQVAGDRERRARRDGELDARAPAASRAAPASRRVSSRIASIVSTTESGGRPPCDSPRSIEPREATRRTPSSRAACSSASIRPCSPCGKT